MISLKMHVRYVNFHFLASESPVGRAIFLGKRVKIRVGGAIFSVAALPPGEKAP